MAGEEEEEVPEQTIGLQRVLQRTVVHLQSSGRKEAGVGDVLAGKLVATGLPPILLGFVTALLVRVMQGSATVATSIVPGVAGVPRVLADPVRIGHLAEC